MKITDIKHRTDLPEFLNKNNLCGIGAEIGVRYGEYSSILLKLWGGSLLYSIDTWDRKNKTAPVNQVKKYLPEQANTQMYLGDYIHTRAKNTLQTYGDRSRMLKMTSANAAKIIEDNILDFCFIDASHRYEHVLRDCNIWWSKIKNGGVLCGHDYKHAEGIGQKHLGVSPAVDEFIDSNNLILHHDSEYLGHKPRVTEDTYQESSWYTIKRL